MGQRSKPNSEWQESPPSSQNGNNNDINPFAFIDWIDRSISGKLVMKFVSRAYRLDSQLPFFRRHRHHKGGRGLSEFNIGRRSFFQLIGLMIDIVFQLIYGILRLLVYIAIFVVILRGLQIPEYLIELVKSVN